MEDKKVYSNIDLLKFIFSFFIVMIHTSLFADVNETAHYIFENIITRIAVPFFFVSSGFFFAKSFEYNKQKKVAGTKTNFKRLRKTEWRIILLYAVWSFIYLFLAMPVNYNGWSIKNIADYLISSAVRFSYYHLWYVYALVFAYPILYFLMRHLKPKAVAGICISLYAAGLFVNSYAYLLPLQTVTSFFEGISDAMGYYLASNILFRALPLMWLGVFVARHSKKPNKLLCPVGAVVCFGLYFAENILLNNFTNGKAAGHYLVFSALCVYFIFLCALQFKKTVNKENGIRLRKMSTVIYCLHVMIQLLLSNYLIPGINSFVLFLLTSIITAGFSVAIVLLSEKRKFRILRYLY